MEGGLGMDLTLVVSLAIIPAVLAMLALCLKIKASKSNPEIYGIEGTVKRTEEGQQDRLQVSGHEDPNIRTPSYDRKLPDIPNDPNEVYKNSVKEDSSSELYATVDDRSDLPNHLAGLQAGAGATSLDPTHHPYAKVKKKVKKMKRNTLGEEEEEEEHPYAKVERKRDNRTQDPEEEDDDGETETEYETAASLLNGGHSITAATAAAAESHHLHHHHHHHHHHPTGEAMASTSAAAAASPYLPPSWGRQATPLPPEPPGTPEQQQQLQQPQQQQQQQFFSGDSQDSGKGYTSISVREPLEMIRTGAAGIAAIASGGNGGAGGGPDGNYATLSEASDEMYAAIEEDNVYMDPEGTAAGSDNRSRPPSRDELDDPSLMYSKVDKNKKRTLRRNEGGASGYAMVNKAHTNSGSRLLAAAAPMVTESQRQTLQLQAAAVVGGPWRSSDRLSSGGSYYASAAAADGGSAMQQETGGGAGGSGGARSRHQQQHRNQTEVDYSGYEVSLTDNWNSRSQGVKSSRGGPDPGYETVPFRETGSRRREESFSERDPGYEVLPCDRKETEEGGGGGNGGRDPDYEILPSGGASRIGGSRDPDYEILPSGGASDLEPREPDYETLPHRFRSDSLDPGYETLTNKGPPPRRGGGGPAHHPSPSSSYGPRSYPPDSSRYGGAGGAGGGGGGGGRGEPGYESLADLRDPDYESVLAGPGVGGGGNGGAGTGEPGYETLPDRVNPTPGHQEERLQASYGRVSKRPRAAPPAPFPSSSPSSSPRTTTTTTTTASSLYAGPASRTHIHQDQAVSGNDFESLRGSRRKLSLDSEEGYETIPADEPPLPPPPPGEPPHSAASSYAALPARSGGMPYSNSGNTSHRLDLRTEGESGSLNYDRLDRGEINYIDDEEDQTVESSSSSSLIHMSVVDSGPGVRRSSVVVIERFDMEEKEENSVETHIFV